MGTERKASQHAKIVVILIALASLSGPCCCDNQEDVLSVPKIPSSNHLIDESLYGNETTNIYTRLAQSRRRRQVADSELLWPFGIIPYFISPSTDGQHRALVRLAMVTIEEKSCVHFIEAGPDDKYHIQVNSKKMGCDSEIGRPKQFKILPMNLNPENCKYGNALHELMHVLGFYHEHTRPDRDKYIEILKENINKDHISDYDKIPEDKVTSLNVEYDLGSIMQYGPNSFAKVPGLVTIVAKDRSKNVLMGQRKGLSDADLERLLKLYRCPKCGKTLTGRSGTFGTLDPEFANSSYCEWRISAAVGERIGFRLLWIDLYHDGECTTDYVLFQGVSTAPKALRGLFCGSHNKTKFYYTLTNRLSVVMRRTKQSEKMYRGFQAEFKVLCGGKIEKSGGILESPNYPRKYPSDLNCTWDIIVSPKKKAVITFDFFSTCKEDYISLLDGKEGPQIVHLSGNSTKRMYHRSRSNQMRVTFVSHKNSPGCLGFSARFWDHTLKASALNLEET